VLHMASVAAFGCSRRLSEADASSIGEPPADPAVHHDDADGRSADAGQSFSESGAISASLLRPRMKKTVMTAAASAHSPTSR
jgi:hypothetical protein